MIETSKVAQKWQEQGFEMMTGMAEWRKQHPKATLREIETELDRRLERVRVKMLEDAALLSEAREWEEKEGGPGDVAGTEWCECLAGDDQHGDEQGVGDGPSLAEPGVGRQLPHGLV